MPKISAEAQKIKLTLTRDTLDTTPIVEKRETWEAAARTVNIPEGVKSEACSYAGVPCEIHTPHEAKTTNNIIIYLHGGGLVEGSVATSREWCCRMAKTIRRPVLAIDYSLAPEYPYPCAINEIIAVCEAISEDKRFSFLSIGADSTGSVLALGALVYLRDNKKALPSSCFLLSPSIDLSFVGDSIKYNSDKDLIVSYCVLAHYAELYAGVGKLESAEISPLFAELHMLPPMLIHVDESELLLDDAVRLNQGILDAGGSVRLIVSRGLWHVWPTWGDFPESQVATQEIAQHIHEHRES